MIPKLAILFGLIISTTCMVQPQIPFYLTIFTPYHEEPNYSFSYDVNNAETGDIKSQEETRHGGTVIGKYSLVQPDGIRRVVDYSADDLRGFRATVNNEGENLERQDNDAGDSHVSTEAPWPQFFSSTEPVAVSRSSIVQTIDRHRVSHPWE